MLILNLLFSLSAHAASCDLSTVEALPNLTLVGESHGMADSENVTTELLKRATAGKLVLGSEVDGAFPFLPDQHDAVAREYGGDPSTSLAFGIEAAVPYTAAFTYLEQDKLVLGSANPVNVLYRHVMALYELPLMRSALARLSPQAPYAAAILKPIQDSLAEICPGQTNAERKAIFMKTVGVNLDKNLATAFVTDLHQAILENVSPQLGGLKLPPLLSRMDRYGADAALQEVLYARREEGFVEQISELLCRYSGHRAEILVVVGHDHLSSLSFKLLDATGTRLMPKTLLSGYAPDRALIMEAAERASVSF